MWRLAIAVVVASGVASAGAPKPPEWFKRPDDKYVCTRYSPGSRPGEPLHVLAPPGKPMIFTIAATRGAQYRATGMPEGATLDAKTGRFTWTIPKDAIGSAKITLYAENAAGAISTTFTLEIASPDLVEAWRAGMGSFEPDCANRIVEWEVVDVDGDGARDLVYTTNDVRDDTPGSSGAVTHARRRVGDHFDAVDRTVMSGGRELITTPDGHRALAIYHSCCFQLEFKIQRVTADGVDTLFEASGSEEVADGKPIELVHDAGGKVKAVIVRQGRETVTTATSRWHDGKYEPE